MCEFTNDPYPFIEACKEPSRDERCEAIAVDAETELHQYLGDEPIFFNKGMSLRGNFVAEKAQVYHTVLLNYFQAAVIAERQGVETIEHADDFVQEALDSFASEGSVGHAAMSALIQSLTLHITENVGRAVQEYFVPRDDAPASVREELEAIDQGGSREDVGIFLYELGDEFREANGQFKRRV